MHHEIQLPEIENCISYYSANILDNNQKIRIGKLKLKLTVLVVEYSAQFDAFACKNVCKRKNKIWVLDLFET